MLTIRFSRVGKRNKAQFKIILQERALAPGGKHVEMLGSYDPHKKIAVLNEERIKHWLGKGATASDTVHNLLVSKGVISEKKKPVKIPRKTEKNEQNLEATGKEEKAEKTTEKKAKERAKARAEIKEPADAEISGKKGEVEK